jgi:hypothetical protein
VSGTRRGMDKVRIRPFPDSVGAFCFVEQAGGLILSGSCASVSENAFD